MAGNIADDWFGIDTPKVPLPNPGNQPKTPTSDAAAEQQIFTDRLKRRTGNRATNLFSGSLGGSTRGYKLLGATA